MALQNIILWKNIVRALLWANSYTSVAATVKDFAGESRSCFQRKNPQSNAPLFPSEGDLALMFLMPNLDESDDGLVEILNGN